MPLTKAETRDRAANDLGRLRLGQQLQDQDKKRIESGYDEVYAFLKDEGLNTWALTGSVPDKLAPYVVALVCDNCLNTYSVPLERYQRIKLIVNGNPARGELGALDQIRRLVTPKYESLSEPTDF